MDIKRVNSVFLKGIISSDLDLHYIDYEKAILRFTLEVEELVQNETTSNIFKSWHKIVVIGDMAILCEKKLKKNDELYLEGRIVYRKYTDRNAITKLITEIYMQDFELIEHEKPMQDVEPNIEDEDNETDWLFDIERYKAREDEPPV